MKNLSFFSRAFAITLCLMFVFVSLHAADSIPKKINVQGKLTTDSGQPLSGATYELTLKLYDANSVVFSKTESGTLDDEGLYNKNIDFSASNINFSKPYKFDVTVVSGGKTITSAKTDLVSSPYAFYASTSTYSLKLDPNGEKLENANFVQSISEWTQANTYNIAVGSASYSIKASSINSVGQNGYVWGIRNGIQEWVSPGSLSIPLASVDTVGGIKLGDNTGLSSDINGDSILRLSSATNSVLGGVIIENNSNIKNENGKISVKYATDLIFGAVKVSTANGLSISNGALGAVPATKSSFGTVKVGNNIDVINGEISVNPSALIIPLATATSTGTVKIGSNIDVITDGTISVKTASESYLGVTKIYNSTGTATDGTMTQNSISAALTNKQDKITESSKLSADLIKNGTTNIVVTSADKTNWDAKENSTNKKTIITSDSTDIEYPSSKAVYTELNKKQDKIDNTNKLNADLIEDGTSNKVFTTVEKSKLSDIAEKAQVNVLEGVQLNGTDLTPSPTDKKVNIITDGTSIQSDGSTLKAVGINNNDTVNIYNNDNFFVWAKKDGSQGWYEVTKKSSGANLSGADLAEIYKSTEKLVPGDVVSIDTTKDNSIVKTKVAEDTLVAGVISTEPGVLMNQNEKGYKLALVGKVPTKVCNEGGNIKRGDLLVSASIAGYAKKASDNPKVGTVIGKALENFDSQKGTILVLVNLQ